MSLSPFEITGLSTLTATLYTDWPLTGRKTRLKLPKQEFRGVSPNRLSRGSRATTGTTKRFIFRKAGHQYSSRCGLTEVLICEHVVVVGRRTKFVIYRTTTTSVRSTGSLRNETVRGDNLETTRGGGLESTTL